MNQSKILITGALGNLGLWITNHLSQKNYDVSILVKNAKNLSIEKQVNHIFLADITDEKSLHFLKEKEFTHIIHLASLNDIFKENYPQDALKINTLGTRNLLQNINYSSIKNFIYFSTFHVYGNQTGNITENTPIQLRHDYASTHYFAEKYVEQFYQTHHLPHTIFRLSNSYGCPQDKNSTKWYLILNDLSKNAFENQKIILKSNGKAVRDFIFMGDVCDIVEKIILTEKASNDIFNLSGEQTFSMLEIAKFVQRAYQERYNKTIPIIINENDLNYYPNDLFISHQKLKNYIDFSVSNQFVEEAKKIFQLLENQY